MSLEEMPKEHVFLHIAKSCAINSLNRGVFGGEGGKSEPISGVSLENSVDTQARVLL